MLAGGFPAVVAMLYIVWSVWFLPGTEPTRVDDWQRDGRTVLPPEYAEWAAASEGAAVAARSAAEDAGVAYRIISPLDGDRYERPAGVDARYATVALTAVGGRADEPVAWFVDGARTRAARWRLVPGTHTIRAVWASGHADSVRIVVEGS